MPPCSTGNISLSAGGFRETYQLCSYSYRKNFSIMFHMRLVETRVTFVRLSKSARSRLAVHQRYEFPPLPSGQAHAVIGSTDGTAVAVATHNTILHSACRFNTANLIVTVVLCSPASCRTASKWVCPPRAGVDALSVVSAHEVTVLGRMKAPVLRKMGNSLGCCPCTTRP